MTGNIGNNKRAKTRERAEDHTRRIAKTHNGDTHNDTRRNEQRSDVTESFTSLLLQTSHVGLLYHGTIPDYG